VSTPVFHVTVKLLVVTVLVAGLIVTWANATGAAVIAATASRDETVVRVIVASGPIIRSDGMEARRLSASCGAGSPAQAGGLPHSLHRVTGSPSLSQPHSEPVN